MKKYIKPSVELLQAESSEIIAVSIVSGNADDSEVLTKENDDWETWEEEQPNHKLKNEGDAPQGASPRYSMEQAVFNGQQ